MDPEVARLLRRLRQEHAGLRQASDRDLIELVRHLMQTARLPGRK